MTTIDSSRIDSLKIQVAGGRGIRVSLLRNRSGEPDELRIEQGWLGGPWRSDDQRPICVPAHLIGELRAALEELTEAK